MIIYSFLTPALSNARRGPRGIWGPVYFQPGDFNGSVRGSAHSNCFCRRFRIFQFIPRLVLGSPQLPLGPSSKNEKTKANQQRNRRDDQNKDEGQARASLRNPIYLQASGRPILSRLSIVFMLRNISILYILSRLPTLFSIWNKDLSYPGSGKPSPTSPTHSTGGIQHRWVPNYHYRWGFHRKRRRVATPH